MSFNLDTAYTGVTGYSSTVGSNLSVDSVAKQLPSPSSAVSASQGQLEALANGTTNLASGGFSKVIGSGSIVDSSKLIMPTALTGALSYGNLALGNATTSASLASSTLTKLASPIFTAGKSATGAAVDVYGSMLSSPQNKIKSVLDDVLGIANSGISGILQGELAKAGSSFKLVSNILDPNTATNVLNQFKSSLLNGVPLTSSGIQSTLFKAIGYTGKSANFLDGIEGAGKSILKDIASSVDGTTGILTLYKNTEMILNGNLSTSQGIFKIIENITSNTALGNFLDLSTQMQIINVVTKTLYNLKVPQLFDDIYNKLTDSNKVSYIKDNIADAIDSGDIDFVSFALKYKSGDWIMSTYPNAIKSLVANYTPAKNSDGSVSPSEYARFPSILAQLRPNWYYTINAFNQKVTDLSIFALFNTAAKAAVIQAKDRELIRSMLIAGNYGGVFDTKTELQKRHPLYPITTT